MHINYNICNWEIILYYQHLEQQELLHICQQQNIIIGCYCFNNNKSPIIANILAYLESKETAFNKLIKL